MKSLLVSVFWHAWEWAQGRRSLRYVATSFTDLPIKRDTRKTRDLILSPWYQALWPEVVLTRTAETSFANSDTGTREGVPFGSLTSQRGDRLLIDDPHSIQTAESDAERETTTRLFRERAIFSVNDPERSAVVVIMQRLHQDDISGVIERYGMDFVKLMLPMEFEIERRCKTRIGFTDPRSYDGEPLDFGRFPAPAISALKRDVTSFAWAGQYQQRPAPREGGLFKLAWFADRLIKIDAVPRGTRWCRHWDLAATKKKSAARTAGVKLGRSDDGRFFVGHVITTQDESPNVRRLILATAQVDGQSVEISLPQDPGQAGKAQAHDFVVMLAGYNVKAEPETGEKETRALPFAAQCQAGNVWIVEGDWNQLYLDELCLFPGGSFADQVDASSGAFSRLTFGDAGFSNFMAWMKGEFDAQERDKPQGNELIVVNPREAERLPAPPPVVQTENDVLNTYFETLHRLQNPPRVCKRCGQPTGSTRVSDGIDVWHVECR